MSLVDALAIIAAFCVVLVVVEIGWAALSRRRGGRP